jgi:polyisoprenoid-binding protein YceI
MRRSLFPLFAVLLLPASARAADQYKIDGIHSAVVFRIKHLNVGYAYGRFNDIAGVVVIDEQNPAGCAFDIQVKSDSIDTANAKRDGHLRSTDFLNTKEFPTISFKSKEVKLAKANTYEVTGDLTFHGVTKPLTIQLQRVGSGADPFGGYRTGFETNFTIRRSEFGMSGMQNALSDDIWLLVSFEAVKQ